MTINLTITTSQIDEQFNRLGETLLTLDIFSRLTDALAPGQNRGLRATQNELVLEAISEGADQADVSVCLSHLTATELRVGLALILNRKEFLIRMARERVQETGRFSWIAGIGRDEAAEIGMLVDEWDPWLFSVSLNTLRRELNPTRRDSKKLGLNNRAVRRALHRLESAGLLVVTRPDKIRTRLEFDLTPLADIADELAGVIPMGMPAAWQAVEEFAKYEELKSTESAIAIRLAVARAVTHPESTWTVKQLLAITGVSRNGWSAAVKGLGIDLVRAVKVGQRANVPTFSVSDWCLPGAPDAAVLADSSMGSFSDYVHPRQAQRFILKLPSITNPGGLAIDGPRVQPLIEQEDGSDINTPGLGGGDTYRAGNV